MSAHADQLTPEERQRLQTEVDTDGMRATAATHRLTRGGLQGLLSGTARRGTVALYRASVEASDSDRAKILTAFGLDPRMTTEDLARELDRLRAEMRGKAGQ